MLCYSRYQINTLVNDTGLDLGEGGRSATSTPSQRILLGSEMAKQAKLSTYASYIDIAVVFGAMIFTSTTRPVGAHKGQR